MRPLVILISIFLVAFFSYICAFAQPAKPQMPPAMKKIIENTPPASEHKSTNDTNEPAPDVNAVVDTNDPNAVKASYRKFRGLEAALENLNERADKETREWRNKTEDKIALAKAVQEQIVRELTFIRELAVEEKAAKTTAAIDGLLMMRKERFNATLKNIEELKKREESKGKDRNKDEAERRRERTPRRRETTDRRI